MTSFLISVQVLFRGHGQGRLRAALASAFGVGATKDDSGDADVIDAGNDANRVRNNGGGVDPDAFLQLIGNLLAIGPGDTPVKRHIPVTPNLNDAFLSATVKA